MKLRNRIILVSFVVIMALVYCMPSVLMLANPAEKAGETKLPDWYPSFLPGKAVTLGLDLQGGIYRVVRVKTDQALQLETESFIRRAKEVLDDAGITVTSSEVLKIGEVELEFSNDTVRSSAVDKLANFFPDWIPRGGDETNQPFILSAQKKKEYTRRTVEQVRETLLNRSNEFGVSDPSVQIKGVDQVVVELPGLAEPRRIKELIKRTARLDFMIVVSVTATETELKNLYPDGYPENTTVHFQKDENQNIIQAYLLDERNAILGHKLSDARLGQDENGLPAVDFSNDTQSAQAFAKLTSENINKPMAIVLDGNVKSAPNINSTISSSGQITGQFSTQEAKDLAVVLRAGALPVDVEFDEERTVGPSLGSDSINKGVMAMGIGGFLVIFFIIIYYKGAGLIAVAALISNMIIILGVLAGVGATLTLPGIAGLILTVGIAVDANVIIYERIREEIRAGRNARKAVDLGYSQAFSAIFDANITTLIAALVLYQYGTGPIKGFAVTLSVGVVASMFTAIVGTRVIFDILTNGLWREKLSI